MKIHVVIPTIGRASLKDAVLPLLGQDFDGLHILYDKERNVSKIRNRGARMAFSEGADYVCFIDDDTVPSPSYAKALRVFLSGIQPDLIQGGITGGIQTDTRFMFVSANLILSKACFSKVSGFDERYNGAGNEDLDLGWRVQEARLMTTYCPAVSVHHPTAPQHKHLPESDDRLSKRHPARWARLKREGTAWL